MQQQSLGLHPDGDSLCLSGQHKPCYTASRIYAGYEKEVCLILRNALSNEFKSSKF